MYADMFQFVKECLEKMMVKHKTCKYPFRKRSEHIKRVFMWAQRLVDGQLSIDRKLLFSFGNISRCRICPVI